MPGWQSKSNVRKNAKKAGYRSGFEHVIAQQLSEHKINPKEIYETEEIHYIVPEKKSKYIPDFKLPNGIYIEVKGRLTAADRRKLQLVKKQNPELDIRILFQYANAKILKGSKTTYAMWAEKHGFQWAEKEIPEKWLKS